MAPIIIVSAPQDSQSLLTFLVVPAGALAPDAWWDFLGKERMAEFQSTGGVGAGDVDAEKGDFWTAVWGAVYVL